MKSFEDWSKKEKTGVHCLLCPENHRVGHQKQGWKAALEWVLSIGDNEEPYTWENIINHKIREELDG